MTFGIENTYRSTNPSISKVSSVSDINSEFTIAAIIPAFNEGALIRGVLEVLRQVELLDEIIVVDDGSSDDTFDVVMKQAEKDGRVRILRHTNNRGKGQAVFSARQSTRASYLLMLDADLLFLTPQHVVSLLKPVLEGQVEMTLGLFRGGYWNTDLSHILTPWLTGQRCLKAELYDAISLRAAEGYGLETALTVAARGNGWRCQKVILHGVTHPPGEYHRGILHGTWRRAKMYLNIITAWYIAGGYLVLFDRKLTRKQPEDNPWFE
jgi:polyisoprenyl-phosphate glycosyltransferase